MYIFLHVQISIWITVSGAGTQADSGCRWPRGWHHFFSLQPQPTWQCQWWHGHVRSCHCPWTSRNCVPVDCVYGHSIPDCNYCALCCISICHLHSSGGHCPVPQKGNMQHCTLAEDNWNCTQYPVPRCPYMCCSSPLNKKAQDHFPTCQK